MGRSAMKQNLLRVIDANNFLTVHGIQIKLIEYNGREFTKGAILDACEEMVEDGRLSYDATNDHYTIAPESPAPATEAPKPEAAIRAIDLLRDSAENEYEENFGEAIDAIDRCRRRLPVETEGPLSTTPAIEIEAKIREAISALQAAQAAIGRAREAEKRAAMLDEILVATKK